MSRMRFTSEERELEVAKLERFNYKIEHKKWVRYYNNISNRERGIL